MFLVSVLKLILVGVMSTMIVGICFGIGAFKGILNSAPDVDPALCVNKELFLEFIGIILFLYIFMCFWWKLQCMDINVFFTGWECAALYIL